MTPLAFGTQTAGSIIGPGVYCAVVGYKPGFGSIARLGMKVMSENLDTIGVIARSVADGALFAGAVSGRDLGDPSVKPGAAPRIGMCRSPAWDSAAPETVALFERVARAVSAAGTSVSERELPERFGAMADAQTVVMQAESARSMGWELLFHRERLSAVLRERLEWGLARNAAEVDAALAVFDDLQCGFPAAMEGLDILLTPSAPGEAPEGLGSTGEPVFNVIWTALHVPCVTVPAGTGSNGMPLGIQIVGRRGEDRATLAWAAWVAADRDIRRVADIVRDIPARVELSNQARDHLWYEVKFGPGYPRLTSSRDGIDRFLIDCTRVGVAVGPEGCVGLHAPAGLADLHAGILRPNPVNDRRDLFVAKADSYRVRWPWLRVAD